MSQNDQDQLQPQWAILELFGHSHIAGYIATQAIGGASFVRVDVPETKEMAKYTKFFNPSAIYSITPCCEEAARTAAQQIQQRPVTEWVVPTKALPDPQQKQQEEWTRPIHWED